jgi:hypothetical protein
MGIMQSHWDWAIPMNRWERSTFNGEPSTINRRTISWFMGSNRSPVPAGGGRVWKWSYEHFMLS